MSVFIDKSVWFASMVVRDRNNQRAKSVLKNISQCVTTDHVLVETWLLLNSRYARSPAERFWRGIRNGPVAVEKVTSADLETAWAIGKIFKDQNFSIVDRTSFAVMERLRITRAASFDDDFAIFRFGQGRGKGFDILR